MVRNKFIPFVLTTAILFVSGCSGSRLRNLISRNDYQSLEELDATGDFYEQESRSAVAGSGQDESRFVSDQRELGEPEPKEGRFSIARLLRRKSPEEGFGEDPFVEPIRTTVEDTFGQPTVKAVSAVKEDRFVAAERAVEEISSSVGEVEKQAEDFFADLKESAEEKTESSFAEAMAQVEASADSLTSGTSHSFADFVARNDSSNTESSADINPAAAFGKESVDVDDNQFSIADLSDSKFGDLTAGPAAESSNNGFDFDSLLDQSETEVAEIRPRAAFEDESNSDVADAFASNAATSASAFDFETSDATQAFDESLVDANSVTKQASSANEDPFALASQKHGFKPLGKQDPWAAFEKDVADQEVAWGEEPARETKIESEFAWGQSQTSDFDDIEIASTFETNDQVFRQVASTSTADESYSLEPTSADQGLVIPLQTEPVDLGSEFVELDSGAELLDDPFFSDSHELAEVPAEQGLSSEAEVSDSGKVGGPATILGWPTRTWFFILGCVILAILLFLPNRQIQDNR